MKGKRCDSSTEWSDDSLLELDLAKGQKPHKSNDKTQSSAKRNPLIAKFPAKGNHPTIGASSSCLNTGVSKPRGKIKRKRSESSTNSSDTDSSMDFGQMKISSKNKIQSSTKRKHPIPTFTGMKTSSSSLNTGASKPRPKMKGKHCDSGTDSFDDSTVDLWQTRTNSNIKTQRSTKRIHPIPTIKASSSSLDTSVSKPRLKKKWKRIRSEPSMDSSDDSSVDFGQIKSNDKESESSNSDEDGALGEYMYSTKKNERKKIESVGKSPETLDNLSDEEGLIDVCQFCDFQTLNLKVCDHCGSNLSMYKPKRKKPAEVFQPPSARSKSPEVPAELQDKEGLCRYCRFWSANLKKCEWCDKNLLKFKPSRYRTKAKKITYPPSSLSSHKQAMVTMETKIPNSPSQHTGRLRANGKHIKSKKISTETESPARPKSLEIPADSGEEEGSIDVCPFCNWFTLNLKVCDFCGSDLSTYKPSRKKAEDIDKYKLCPPYSQPSHKQSPVTTETTIPSTRAKIRSQHTKDLKTNEKYTKNKESPARPESPEIPAELQDKEGLCRYCGCWSADLKKCEGCDKNLLKFKPSRYRNKWIFKVVLGDQKPEANGKCPASQKVTSGQESPARPKSPEIPAELPDKEGLCRYCGSWSGNLKKCEWCNTDLTKFTRSRYRNKAKNNGYQSYKIPEQPGEFFFTKYVNLTTSTQGTPTGPKPTYTGSDNKESFMEVMRKELTCGICTEESIDPRELKCSHYFCKDCLQEWIGSNGSNTVTCPVCMIRTWLPRGTVNGLNTSMLIQKLAHQVRLARKAGVFNTTG